MNTFELDGHDFIELCNLLKVTGMCESGGLAKTLISEGQVKVDGIVELRKRCKIRQGQLIEYENTKITVIK